MIGIFDSGLGGLTVLKEVKSLLPQYDYLYFGDTLHVPYGGRSQEAVFDLTKNACQYLFDNGCRLVILACNTASAKALRQLQREYLPEVKKKLGDDINILGVIRPVAEEIARSSAGKVGVIATIGTVKSKTYETELLTQKGSLKVYEQACPLLVPLIEENWIKRKELKSILRYYLRPLKEKKVDTLILGCTHYPLILRQVRGIMGKSCAVPNPAQIVAVSLKDYLLRHLEIAKSLKSESTVKYVVTDLNENFQALANKFLGENIIINKI